MLQVCQGHQAPRGRRAFPAFLDPEDHQGERDQQARQGSKVQKDLRVRDLFLGQLVCDIDRLLVDDCC